jgi:hypothetical protein
MAGQQQHSLHAQSGHSLADGLALHSKGRHPQSAHFISTIFLPLYEIKNQPAKG